ncbi:signal peptidase I [Bacteroides sp. KH569_7]|uniref:Signal peptidase I n=1 Tax=Bacteroides muris (ex Fokt et al. 2023) TaxID=2937417 RepID=A0A9X2NZQ9_9BACE|nr:signal peptidase I [Bacteroides muris (ex Fokt et al. 2023)]MCR6508903.1 signal peptidase I [Bacteroides muris (ex Fokt et al. 2023)]
MEEGKKQGSMRTWLERLTNIAFGVCVLVVVYCVLQVFVVTSFKIPSDSMSPTLLPGDYVLVDKCSAGARLFDVLDAVEGKEVDIHRLPGWRKFRRDDVLVFNFPYQPGRWDSIAFDVMRYYVKRCVAVPGDTLAIRKGYYRIAGHGGNIGFLPAQKSIAMLPDSGATGVQMETFPWDKRLGWTVKEFGPFPVPARGQTVGMDSTSWRLYRQLVGWEQKKRLRIDAEGHVFLGDSLIHEYRFRENYYFVAGDKAENSQDSRYWGLLPEPFIVGRAVRIWKSVEPDEDTRWDRIWKKIE